MKREVVRPRAVVADGRALERSLVRFLLDEAGYVVVAEAVAAHDTARAVREHRPDVVVVHENAAVDRGISVIADLRGASPATKVILVTMTNAASTDLHQEADAVIEEGAGIKELGFALAGTRRAPESPTNVVEAPRRPRMASQPAPRKSQRWLARMQGAAAACIVIIAVAVIARPHVDLPSGDDGNRAVEVHLSTAYRSLDELAERVTTASPSEIASLARILITERAFVVASGADVSALDQEIVTTLRPLLPSMSPEAGATLLAILGELLDGDAAPPPPATPVDPSSSPAPPPRPEPSETPGPMPEAPAPSETPQPSPEPTANETPSPTPEPTPSETPSPSPDPTPSETPSPTPTETPSPTPEPTPSETPSPSPDPTPGETPSPTPTETPSPTPGETPSPTPTETPSPTPTETPSPTPSETPSETPSPAPSETPSPTASETPSPTPTETPSTTASETPSPTPEPTPIDAGVLIVPGGIGLLAAISGAARRRRSRQ